MEKENKSFRTKQVQFRMNPETFYKLKATIVYDKDVHSMADLFNEAAEKYLNEKRTEAISNATNQSYSNS